MAVTERRASKALNVIGDWSIQIDVGIHGDEASAPHAGSDGLTVGEIGAIHEFGAPEAGIPQRSYLRAWYDESADFIRATLKSQLGLAVTGQVSPDVALERVALAFEASVKERIRRHIPPPNAPSTIAAKGSSTPLIDTGQLLNAIRGTVRRSQARDARGRFVRRT